MDHLFQDVHSCCIRPKKLARQAHELLLHWCCKNYFKDFSCINSVSIGPAER